MTHITPTSNTLETVTRSHHPLSFRACMTWKLRGGCEGCRTASTAPQTACRRAADSRWKITRWAVLPNRAGTVRISLHLLIPEPQGKGEMFVVGFFKDAPACRFERKSVPPPFSLSRVPYNSWHYNFHHHPPTFGLGRPFFNNYSLLIHLNFAFFFRSMKFCLFL